MAVVLRNHSVWTVDLSKPGMLVPAFRVKQGLPDLASTSNSAGAELASPKIAVCAWRGVNVVHHKVPEATSSSEDDDSQGRDETGEALATAVAAASSTVNGAAAPELILSPEAEELHNPADEELRSDAVWALLRDGHHLELFHSQFPGLGASDGSECEDFPALPATRVAPNTERLSTLCAQDDTHAQVLIPARLQMAHLVCRIVKRSLYLSVTAVSTAMEPISEDELPDGGELPQCWLYEGSTRLTEPSRRPSKKTAGAKIGFADDESIESNNLFSPVTNKGSDTSVPPVQLSEDAGDAGGRPDLQTFFQSSDNDNNSEKDEDEHFRTDAAATACAASRDVVLSRRLRLGYLSSATFSDGILALLGPAGMRVYDTTVLSEFAVDAYGEITRDRRRKRFCLGAYSGVQRSEYPNDEERSLILQRHGSAALESLARWTPGIVALAPWSGEPGNIDVYASRAIPAGLVHMQCVPPPPPPPPPPPTPPLADGTMGED